MKEFIYKFILFIVSLILLLIIIAFLTSFIVKQRHFKIWETDSNTLVMPRSEHYDIVLSGASHARILSRHKNHLRLENILNKKIFNVGQGAASCGIEEQYFYLKYFFDEGNKVDTVLYFLSPPLLYSRLLPIASNTFNHECFSFRFLFRYMRFDAGENKRQRLLEYFRSKFTWEWIGHKPDKSVSMDKVLPMVDSLLIREGIAMYYNLEEESDERFSLSCSLIEKEINYVLSKDSYIIFIIPPAVFGKWPGHEQTVDFAKRMSEKYDVNYFDFSEIIMDPSFYLDHHHLNTRGVIHFSENFLVPIFNK